MKLKILPWIGENNCAACKNTSNPAIRRYIITAVFLLSNLHDSLSGIAPHPDSTRFDSCSSTSYNKPKCLSCLKI